MKKIGIGYEDYKRIIDDNCYYVDKTLLISDIVKKGGMVTLFTRPRRFGKTLALSTIQTFFEKEYDFNGNIVDNRHYFDGKRILGASSEIVSMMGQYPVIRLSLKSAKKNDFESAFLAIRDDIATEYSRHACFVEKSDIDSNSKKLFESFKNGKTDWEERDKHFKSKEERATAINSERAKYSTSIKVLSNILSEAYKEKVIILLDEYDVPLECAYYHDFYDDMVDFIRSLFESALKTNDALKFGVVTGCLRISKESIFTGLNNLAVNSIRSSNFGEFFGFSQAETEELLGAYDLIQKKDEVKDWYDGYLFGENEVYNPWSVLTYVSEHMDSPLKFPEPYWSNTSSNSIIKDMICKADEEVRSELDTLISGGAIEKKIHEDITYDDIDKNNDNLWNFLFFTGYLKKVSERQDDDDIYLKMTIPNKEIFTIYKNQIREWFDDTVKATDLSVLYDAIKNKNTEGIEEFVTDLLQKSISYFDSDEAFYHGFFLSLLFGMEGYTPKSNREEGDGRPDVILYPTRPKDPAYIFEFKVRKKFNEMDDGLKESLGQIVDSKYEEGVLHEGYAGVISYGICFCKKSCTVAIL